MKLTILFLLILLAGCGAADDSVSEQDEYDAVIAGEEEAAALYDERTQQMIEAERQQGIEQERREQQELREAELADERELQRETEQDRTDAEQFAIEFFRDFTLEPEWSLPEGFGEPELVPADKETVAAIQRGMAGEGWDDFVRAVFESPGSDLLPQDIRSACESFSNNQFRYTVSADTSDLMMVYRTRFYLSTSRDTGPHPDSERWIIPCPVGTIAVAGVRAPLFSETESEVNRILRRVIADADGIRTGAETSQSLGEPVPEGQVEQQVYEVVRKGFEEICRIGT